MSVKIFLMAICLLLVACDDGVINPASELERKYPEPWLSCEEGVSWEEAHEFVGKVIYVVGPVSDIDPPDLSTADSVTVALGDSGVAGSQFLVNIAFGESTELRGRVGELRIGDDLCVTGGVKMAGDRPSISVRGISQFGQL